MLKDRPLGPKRELIDSIEYSAKHPQLYDVLQLASADMSLFEYYCLDVLGALTLALFVSLWVLMTVLKKLVLYLFSSRAGPKVKRT